MNTPSPISLQRQGGLATILVAAAMAAFSVLALTVLTDARLRARFFGAARDLHVVLYKADTGLQTIAARLNIPSDPASTANGSGDDSAVALEIPIPQTPEVGADASPWTHVVQLGPALTVCCDGDGVACDAIDPSQSVYPGTVNRSGDDLLASPRDLTGDLSFDVAPVAIDDAIARQLPPYQSWTASLLKATRVSSTTAAGAATAPPAAAGGSPVSCRLRMSGETLVTGSFHVHETAVASGTPGVTPGTTISGTLQLRFAQSQP